MCAYLLRSIPLDLWAKVRARAQAEGRTIRAVLIRLLYRYAKGEI